MLRVWLVLGGTTRHTPACRPFVAATSATLDEQVLGTNEILPGQWEGSRIRRSILIPRAQSIHCLEEGKKLGENSYFLCGGELSRTSIMLIELKGPVVALELCLAVH